MINHLLLFLNIISIKYYIYLKYSYCKAFYSSIIVRYVELHSTMSWKK